MHPHPAAPHCKKKAARDPRVQVLGETQRLLVLLVAMASQGLLSRKGSVAVFTYVLRGQVGFAMARQGRRLLAEATHWLAIHRWEGDSCHTYVAECLATFLAAVGLL